MSNQITLNNEPCSFNEGARSILFKVGRVVYTWDTFYFTHTDIYQDGRLTDSFYNRKEGLVIDDNNIIHYQNSCDMADNIISEKMQVIS